ncbi:hypothetical protein [Streptomyces virginiae]|uniref:hypothetical protein n=1 Tax=Streptomyces virginiae TaxID=1961 RepID=UPI0030E0B0AB
MWPGSSTRCVGASAHLTHGQVIKVLVANRLTSPAPLVRVRDWARTWAVEEVFGITPDVINDGRMAGYGEADWKAKLADHVIGGAVTPMYFTTAGGVSLAFGDSIQRGVDTWAWEWGTR